MTAEEFNEKYSDYLEKGHYGLAINHPEVIAYLDRVFSDILIYYPDFEYAQIKLKFGRARAYFNSTPLSIDSIIEERINEIIQKDEETQ